MNDEIENELSERLGAILAATADALHGVSHPNGLHSFHDLPELAARLRKERDEAIQNNEAMIVNQAVVEMSHENYDNLYDLLTDYCEVLKVSIHEILETDDPDAEVLRTLSLKFARCKDLLRII